MPLVKVKENESFEQALRRLLAAVTAPEQQFLAGLLLGELRQGALEGVMADAIAAAANVPAADVRRASMLAGNLAAVASAALAESRAGLERFRLTIYEPLAPMLASPAKDIDAALQALGSAVLEYKLDGARVQIHKGSRGARVFSRTGRDVTASVPEVVAAIEALPARAAILDGEVIALTPEGRARPFQDTMRRFGRKLDVEQRTVELPLSLFAFDCLHLEGEDLIDKPLAERLERLAAIVPPTSNVPRLVTSDRSAAQAFLDGALALGHEGVMAKAPASLYEAGSRGAAWLKVKVAHTLDLVVLAAEWGSGRRQGWLSNLHLGARDADGGFVMLGKTFKGLTDELLVVLADVGFDGELRVEQQALHQRAQREREARRIVALRFGDERGQQREVECVGAQVPARLEPDPLVHAPDRDALLGVDVVDDRPAQAQQVLALLPQQPLLDLRRAQQIARSLEGEQVSVERGDEALGVAFQERLQLGEELDVGVFPGEEGEPFLEVFLHPQASYRWREPCDRSASATG